MTKFTKEDYDHFRSLDSYQTYDNDDGTITLVGDNYIMTISREQLDVYMKEAVHEYINRKL